MTATWFIYTHESWKVHKFASKEEMEKQAYDVLEECYLDGDSGWSEEVYHAVGGYGELPDIIGCSDYEEELEKMKTHEVVEEVIDRKENYTDEEGDEWPYCDDWDYVARYYLREIKQ